MRKNVSKYLVPYIFSFSDLCYGIATWSIIGRTVIFDCVKPESFIHVCEEKIVWLFYVENTSSKLYLVYILDQGMSHNQRKHGWFEIQPGYEILLLDVPRDESRSGGGVNSYQAEK